jgi:hypothetical protein
MFQHSAPSSGRQMVSIEEIKDSLVGQLEAVIDRYAKPGAGSYQKNGKYFMLNPGRPDRSVGSFCIRMSGPDRGRWSEYAGHSKSSGDVIDLIALSCGLSLTDAIKEARAFLGLDTETPELKRKREIAAAAAKARRIAAEADRAKELDKARKRAEGLWLSGQVKLEGTPVAAYLAGRSIDLAAFGHMPGALRYHPECRYYWTEDWEDPQTGEVKQQVCFKPMPAMVSAIVKGSKIIDCHRTYLQRGPEGWTKADLPDAKKVFADYTGGAVRLCGAPGPRGGRLKLNEAPQGSRVYITEGIENGLSLMAIRAMLGQPPAFVIAAGMIWNLGKVDLPATVTEVVLCADNDQGEAASAALEGAIAAHAAKGRQVRVWRSERPGEDLNDALKRALKERGRP